MHSITDFFVLVRIAMHCYILVTLVSPSLLQDHLAISFN